MSSSGKPVSQESLGGRLREIRTEVFGDDGTERLADQLGISPGAWGRYEEFGELAPAQVLLRFIELTGVDPLWLLDGREPKYRRGTPKDAGGSNRARHRAVSSRVCAW